MIKEKNLISALYLDAPANLPLSHTKVNGLIYAGAGWVE